MTTIELRVDPGVLENPDADLRYVIPETIEARSGGTIRSEGYDYEGDAPVMVLFLVAQDAPSALELIRAVLDSEVLLGNHLRGKYELSADAEPPS